MSDNPYEPSGDGERAPPSYQPPDEPAIGYAWSVDHRNRGGCLTAFLVLMMIANPIVGIFYLLAQDFMRRGLSPRAPDWAFAVLAFVGLVNFVCAIAIWKWKKWGVIGTVSVAVVTLMIYFVIGAPPMSALVGLVGPALLIFLVRPLWRGFE